MDQQSGVEFRILAGKKPLRASVPKRFGDFAFVQVFKFPGIAVPDPDSFRICKDRDQHHQETKFFPAERNHSADQDVQPHTRIRSGRNP